MNLTNDNDKSNVLEMLRYQHLTRVESSRKEIRRGISILTTW